MFRQAIPRLVGRDRFVKVYFSMWGMERFRRAGRPGYAESDGGWLVAPVFARTLQERDRQNANK